MEFPGTDSFINANDNSNKEHLDLLMLSGDAEKVDENLVSWKIKDVTSTSITVDLEFKDPLAVSQGDVPDILIVQAGL